MAHLDALIGIVVLMAISLWIVGKARADDPFIARIIHPERRRDEPNEDDDVRWRWHAQ